MLVMKLQSNEYFINIYSFPGIPEFYDKLSNLKDFKNDF